MNKLQLIELITEHHSMLPSRQLEIYVEMVGNKIALETDLAKKTFLLSSISGKRWYDLDRVILKIDKVYFNDVQIPRLIGEPLIDDDEFIIPEDTSDTALSSPTSNASNKRMWMISNYDSSSSTSKTCRLGIVEKSSNSFTRDGRTSNYQSCSITGTSNIRVYAVTTITPFTVSSTLGESSNSTSDIVGPLLDIPYQFHEVLLNGVIAMGYKHPKNFNPEMLSFFDNEFKKGIKDIKRFERTKTGTGFIKPQDF
tara:strand:+ start:84 stop:845 length:762 start_codon:yes stop_codon:yes gene_type:complete